MAPPKSERLIFYGRNYCCWHPKDGPPQFVQVIRWRIVDGKIMVIIKEANKPLAGVALVEEEELYESIR